MGHRLSRIYTRTGDDGSTGLGDGQRVPKDDARVASYGTVDEANAALGLLLAVPLPEDVRALVVHLQHQLFDLAPNCASPATPRSTPPMSRPWNSSWTITTPTCRC